MSTAELDVKVRRMIFTDVKDIFAIDQAIRAAGPSATYAGFTTPQLFGLEEPDPAKRADILEVAKLVDLGLVAEYRGKTCGFVVGRQTYLAEHHIQEGEIAIIGVSPDHQGKRIAAKLVDAICDLFRSRGAQEVRIGIDPSDVNLPAFFEGAGFMGQRTYYYHKML